MAIDLKLIDELLKGYKKPEDIIGKSGLLKQLTKAVLERALAAEMTDHVGYEKHAAEGRNGGNSRNGSTTKTLKGDFGEMELETPRDRDGSFEPKMVGKRQTRFTGMCVPFAGTASYAVETYAIVRHCNPGFRGGCFTAGPALSSARGRPRGLLR